MQNRSTHDSAHRRPTLVSAAGVFLLVCGVVLLLLAGPPLVVGGDRGGATAPAAETAKHVRAARASLSKAEAAIEDGNLGVVRDHLREAGEILAVTLAGVEDEDQ